MLTVIICTYNREKYLRPLLESLVANTLPKSEYEILLVDNNCMDNTRGVCRKFADEHPDVFFRYVEEHEQGLSAAKNCGIREGWNEIQRKLGLMDDSDMALAAELSMSGDDEEYDIMT